MVSLDYYIKKYTQFDADSLTMNIDLGKSLRDLNSDTWSVWSCI